MNELKKRLEELARLEKIADMADDAMMEDPTNEEKEKTFDEAYKAEFDAFIAVANLIVKMTNGQIDEKNSSYNGTDEKKRDFKSDSIGRPAAQGV